MDWGLLGNDWATDLLAEQVAQDKVRHAYLLTGPQGIGRRTLALRLAQALNCLQPPSPGQPCRACRSCVQIERMQHPDLAVLQSESDSRMIVVDQVRQLQHSLSLHPYEARYRVALLLHFEEAHPSASNALLKTLEEPAPHVVLILTAESAERLFPTIVSRCEVLRLRPMAVEQLSLGLQEHFNVPSEQANLLAHISNGRPGYALRILREPELLDQRRLWLDELLQLMSWSRVERFAFAESISKDRSAMHLMLLVWLSFWRDVLLKVATTRLPAANSDYVAQVDEVAAHLTLSQAHTYLAAVERTLELMETNINPRLAAEVLMLDLPFNQPVAPD